MSGWNRYVAQRSLIPEGEKRVRIRDSLHATWGRTQMMVPTEGGEKDPASVVDTPQQMPPMLPSGVRRDHVNLTLEKLLKASQLGTAFYGELVSPDPEDEKFALVYRQVRDNGPGGTSSYIPGVGKVILDDAFWAYCKRKKDAAQEAAYKLWKYQQMDLTNPAKRQWWISKNPDWVHQMELGKRKFMYVMGRLADIRIYGIQDEEDMKFLWIASLGADSLVKLGEKKIPTSDIIEAAQFPGIQTPRGEKYPGVFGPSRVEVSVPNQNVDVGNVKVEAPKDAGMLGNDLRGLPWPDNNHQVWNPEDKF